jgi:hypothetical protein
MSSRLILNLRRSASRATSNLPHSQPHATAPLVHIQTYRHVDVPEHQPTSHQSNSAATYQDYGSQSDYEESLGAKNGGVLEVETGYQIRQLPKQQLTSKGEEWELGVIEKKL